MSNNSKPILYGTKASPPTRAVLLTLKALNVDYEFRVVDIFRSEHLSAKYRKMNPSLTIPTLEIDREHYIGDSHAIMAYLVGRYGANDDPLYPKELYKRAKVDQMLHFANSVLFTTCAKQSFTPIFAGERNDVPVEKIKAIKRSYKMLEAFFEQNNFVAGEKMTIADFSCFTAVATVIKVLENFEPEKYPKLHAWLVRMNSLPYAEEIMEHEAVWEVVKFLQNKFSKL